MSNTRTAVLAPSISPALPDRNTASPWHGTVPALQLHRPSVPPGHQLPASTALMAGMLFLIKKKEKVKWWPPAEWDGAAYTPPAPPWCCLHVLSPEVPAFATITAPAPLHQQCPAPSFCSAPLPSQEFFCHLLGMHLPWCLRDPQQQWP